MAELFRHVDLAPWHKVACTQRANRLERLPSQMDMTADSTTATCPTCGGTSRPIKYGEVNVDMLDGMGGDVALGGCVVIGDRSPAWECRSCDAQRRIAEASRVRPRRHKLGRE